MKTGNIKQIFTGLVFGAVLIATPAKAGNPELPLDLQSAGDFVVLAKSGISTVPPSNITGDMGVSPITSTAITGFALIMDGSGEFSTSAQVTGKIYAADYAPPTPVKMTTAISDMETAYTTAAGRTLPDTNNLGATAGSDKDIGGLTFAPGLHKWTTGVLVSTNVIFDAAGNPDAIFIFQIEGDLTIASGQSVILAGGAQAKNIFWQIAGGAGATIGTTAHIEGVVLTATAINVLTGGSFNGKLLAQTDVNIQQNTIVDSSLINQYTLTYDAGLGGSVLGDSPQFVLEGENGTEVTAVADPGFVFVGWTGTVPSILNPRTDLNVMADITVEAQFLPEYTLTYNAGLGGSVSGVSPQTVLEGEDGTMVTAVADPGFAFIGWTGTDPSLDNPRTDLNVMADITVEAQFQAIEYTLTYTAGLGGSVLGVSPQTVLEGEDGTLVTAVADPGFVFVEWTGTDPSIDNPRTDLNVMADITVEAQFLAAPEIAVEQPVGNNVADGGSKNFGPVLVNSTKDLVFTITNSGAANLDLTLPITFSGLDASLFSVTAPPSTSVLPGGTTTFTVRFAPLTLGAKEAALQLANNDSNEDPFDINLTGLGSGLVVTFTSPITLNPQTGLLEQTVRISNTDLVTVDAVRLFVNDLPVDQVNSNDNVQVYNASGTIGGIPYLQHSFPVAQGEEIEFLIEYYRVSRRSDFTPVFGSEATLPVTPPAPEGEVIEIELKRETLNGRILLDFSTVPGRQYVVQYSADLTVWKTTDPIITAPSNRTQWYDDGPPKTESKPSSVGSRFYRIIQLP